MKVLVTGAGGFVGRALVDALLRSSGEATGNGRVGRLVHLDRAPSALADSRIVSICGDVGDRHVRAAALEGGVDCVFHLAAVPGGAAAADPAASERVNVEATLALAHEAGAMGASFVYASTIAVLGTPTAPVDDATEPAPASVYGRHKREVEIALAGLVGTGTLRAAALRLPGIVARPRGGTGLKSAFLSDLFHAARAGEAFVCPVSPAATVWLMSVHRAADNLVRASRPQVIEALAGRALTLPALRTTIADLVAALAAATGSSPDLVRYAPEAPLEAHFGRLPPLATERAHALGFEDDGDLATLVASVLEDLATGSERRSASVL